MTRAELVERVARKAVCGSRPAPSLNCVDVCSACDRIATTAIDIVLEEAARVADSYEIPMCETAASHIAAAILALIHPPVINTSESSQVDNPEG